MDWVERLRNFLCQMYQELGGNCDDLGFNAPQWVTTVVATYAAKGPPVFATEAERQAFAEVLDGLEAHLALPENTLSPSDNQKLTNLIASLRQAVGV